MALGPLGARLEQLVAGRGEQQDRRPLDGVEQVVEELEERRRRDVDVVDDRDQRAPAGDRLEQLADPPEQLRPGELGVDRPIAAATRSTTAVGSSGPPATPRAMSAILPSATSSGSSSLMPAALRTISAIGQNVTPSPYGRQRPRRTWLRSLAEARIANSRISRDLPTPASPMTVSSSQERVAPTSRSVISSRSISASRPTNGVVDRGALGVRRRDTATSRNAATGSALPLRVSGGMASTSIWSRARR